MFNRLACFWPKGYQRRSLGKSHQNGDYLKQAMRKKASLGFPRLPRWQPLGQKHAKRLNIKTLASKRQKHLN